MEETKTILEALKAGDLSVEEALMKLKTKPYDDLGFAKVDLHRKTRQGMSEVIYGAGKTGEEIAAIVRSLLENGQKSILITRLSPEKAGVVSEALAGLASEKAAAVSEELAGISPKEAVEPLTLNYNERASLGTIGPKPEANGIGRIIVATGGTSDIPVAEEAAVTAEMMGNDVLRLYDVGVAGLHRLMSHLDELMSASVVIAVAGMEGALASVIGGLVSCPVIAVPTSVGYGASFGGLSALLAMLNSCASGTAVVNIDNGFGAGFLASRINHMGSKEKKD